MLLCLTPDDFTRQWGTPWTGKGFNNVKNYVRINPLTAEWALRALIDFTLSNARRFYSSMGNPLEGKGLRILFFFSNLKNDIIHMKTSLDVLKGENLNIVNIAMYWEKLYY